MEAILLKPSYDDPFERLFAWMMGASAVAHVVLVVLALVVPPMFRDPPPPKNVIQIESLIAELPKGPGIGTQAPTKDQSAARAPDHRLKIVPDTMAEMGMKQKTPGINSKRLNYKERRRSEAIENIKQLREARGGEGTSNHSGGNEFSVYLARVQSRLRSSWVLPAGLSPEDKAKKVKCRIKVNAAGAIISQSCGSSGLPHLDRSAMAAISAVGSLPAPPPLIVTELETKGLGITFDPMQK